METTRVYRGYIGRMEEKMATNRVYWANIGRMEVKMETTGVYWGYIGRAMTILVDVPGDSTARTRRAELAISEIS